MARSVGLNKSGGKRNLTIQLPEETIQAAKELAARKGTSVSGMVTQKIQEMVEADIRYQKDMELALELMHNAGHHGGGKWTREELYEEMLNE